MVEKGVNDVTNDAVKASVAEVAPTAEAVAEASDAAADAFQSRNNKILKKTAYERSFFVLQRKCHARNDRASIILISFQDS